MVTRGKYMYYKDISNNNIQDKNFGDKANFLSQIYSIEGVNVLDGICFYFCTDENINDACKHLFNLVQRKFRGDGRVIIRSSSIYEDLYEKSNAGFYSSKVTSQNYIEFFEVFLDVVNSFKNETVVSLVVQPFLEKMSSGGVVFLEDESIFVELSNTSSNVVSGVVENFLVYNKTDSHAKDIMMSELLKQIRELNIKFMMPLDIEWGAEGNVVYIFQVRPLTKTIGGTYNEFV